VQSPWTRRLPWIAPTFIAADHPRAHTTSRVSTPDLHADHAPSRRTAEPAPSRRPPLGHESGAVEGYVARWPSQSAKKRGATSSMFWLRPESSSSTIVYENRSTSAGGVREMAPAIANAPDEMRCDPRHPPQVADARGDSPAADGQEKDDKMQTT